MGVELVGPVRPAGLGCGVGECGFGGVGFKGVSVGGAGRDGGLIWRGVWCGSV